VQGVRTVVGWGVALDPAPSALIQHARKQIRTRMRTLRDAFPRAALEARSERIVDRVAALPAYERARALALFFPLAGEVDLRPLDARARAEGKRVYYPFMEPRQTGFVTGLARVEDLAELADRGRRFLEPPPEAPRAARGEVDLIVVPALAVSSTGHRLGYGMGFYDATLPDFCPPALAVVVAYDFQLLAELPSLDHDVAGDHVVTDVRTLDASPPPR